MTSAADCVHILMCTNAFFLQHAAVCLASLLTNNSDLFFNIVIVERVTEDLDKEKLRRFGGAFSQPFAEISEIRASSEALAAARAKHTLHH
jgi:lipopolysaccharide biosynthesis glycosyltransferase